MATEPNRSPVTSASPGKTVHNHLNAIYRKLDTQSLTQAVLSAVRLGIIDLDQTDRPEI